MKKQKHSNSGYITLYAIVTLGAIATAIISTIALTSIRSLKTSTIFYQSNQAKALANACAETALQQIRDLETLTGTSNLTLDNGACTYTITDLGGESREIQATATVDTAIRKIKISIDQINPQINIAQWQEVGDF